MKITRTGSAPGRADSRTARVRSSTQSGALSAYPYGFAARFEGVKGSNPEELIAAAHASCFTMALVTDSGKCRLRGRSDGYQGGGHLEQVGEGFEITSSHLTLRAKIPGIDQAKFTELAGMAKAGCPVSKLLKTEITLDASLV